MKIRSIDELCELADVVDELKAKEENKIEAEIAELKTLIEEAKAYLQKLKFVYDIEPKQIVKTQISSQLSILKQFKQILVGLYIMKLETEFLKADAIYEDKIIECIGEDGFYCIYFAKAIQLCGCINGRRLYAI